MNRVYSNQLPGQQRIHVELTREDIKDLLDDLNENHYFAPTQAFLGILRTAHEMFTGVPATATVRDAARTASGQQPETGQGPDPCSACPVFPCRKCAPAVGQSAEAHDTDQAAARVNAWIASEPVTARSEFGNGYREALRDIVDVINGRQTVEDER